MIYLSISCNSNKGIEELAKILLIEKLAIKVCIERSVKSCQVIDGHFKMTEKFNLSAKTKSNMFTKIEGCLDKILIIYEGDISSFPIINVTEELYEGIQKLNNS